MKNHKKKPHREFHKRKIKQCDCSTPIFVVLYDEKCHVYWLKLIIKAEDKTLSISDI